MSAETLDRLEREALQRLAYFVNRSAGQHMRAMRCSWALFWMTYE